MKIRINQYIDSGNYENERIAFKVEEECDLKFFIVHLTYKTQNGFFQKPSETYWFAPQKVNVGDWVVLYTKKGINSSKVNDAGNSSYFYYWGLEDSIINKLEDGIVLAQVESWETKWDKQ